MALYRKYRPATFAEVVGQEQVTEPLSVALDSGRINHAYLFSGPRGCGKTSSARILARSLNCVEGPTSTPCGQCNSCVSLAPGGPGNLDVTEMDAASHRGVEDMRALRDRAIYAPAESRYRVFIIDEAHMITNEGFNALLKIVEEPPAHLIFIFATTEPDKVIQTIRSRTHHYPFRLLTPQAMAQLISSVAEEEGAVVEESVYPLLIQAGGGSPRDTLSIFDQLLAGTGEDGLTYEKAIPLLGITDDALLDATVTALAQNDAAALFTTIDDVIEAGHDPRRFALDLLDRLRDLMIISAVPSAFSQGLVTAPSGREEVLTQQAQQFSSSQLARMAQTVNDGIGDLRGATSARLLLEVLFGHLLVETQHVPAPVAPSGRDAAASMAQAQARAAAEPEPAPGESVADKWLRQRRNTEKPTKQAQPEPKKQVQPEPPLEAPKAEPAAVEQPAEAPEASASDLSKQLTSQWGTIRKDIMARNRTAGIMLAQAHVLGLRDDTLVLGHTTGVLAHRLNDPSNNQDVVAVVSDHAGRQLKVHCVVGTDPKAAGITPQAAPSTWKPDQGKQPAEPAAEEAESKPSTWGQPARVGGTETPSQEPAPRPAKPDRNKPASWQETVAAAKKNAAERAARPTFDDEVPLPPEPGMDEAPPPEEYAPPAPEDEEQMMADAAQEPGETDRRTSMDIAAELLEQELGARRV